MKKQTADGQARKCWRLFNFKIRYEIKEKSDRWKKGPLFFTKSFVGSGQDNESIGFYQQKMMLKSKPDFLKNLGAFGELRDIAANRSFRYRGYLLDESFQPATTKQISLWIGEDIKSTVKILKVLENVHLIERVPLPHFDPQDDEAPDELPADAGSLPPVAGQSRAKSGKDGQPLNNGNPKGETASGKRQNQDELKTAAATAAASAEPQKQEQDKPQSQSQSRSRTAEAEQPKPNSESNAPTPTGTGSLKPEPIKPPETDLSGQDSSQTSSVAPGQTSFDSRLETIANLRTHDKSAKAFADDIFERLHCRGPKDSQTGQRNWVVFANKWDEAMNSGLSIDQLERLWAKARKEADRHARMNARKKKWKVCCEASFTDVFNKLLKAECKGK